MLKNIAAALLLAVASFAAPAGFAADPQPDQLGAYDRILDELIAHQASGDASTRKLVPEWAASVTPEQAAKVMAQTAANDAPTRQQALAQLAKWRAEITEQLEDKAKAVIVENNKALITAVEAALAAGTGVAADIQTIGFKPWDQMIKAVGGYSIKFNDSILRFGRVMDSSGYRTLIEADSLVRLHKYTEASKSLDKVDSALEVLLNEINRAAQERNDQIYASALVEQPLARVGMAFHLTETQFFEENLAKAYHSKFAAERELIAFLKQRDGKVSWDGKTYLFENGEDVDAAGEILGRIRAADAKLDELL